VVHDAPTIETERLSLRPWSDEDRDAFALINADSRVMEHFPALMSREESDALIDRIDAGWE
jgi:RimJ/RimL family protein N-acetyltransferase